MKKIIIITIAQLITMLIFAEIPKTVDGFFQQIYSNQPDELSYKRAITKNEKKKILVEINRKNDILRILVNDLGEMAKTNASVKEAIINEIVAHYKKGISQNFEQSVIESYYGRLNGGLNGVFKWGRTRLYKLNIDKQNIYLNFYLKIYC